MSQFICIFDLCTISCNYSTFNFQPSFFTLHLITRLRFSKVSSQIFGCHVRDSHIIILSNSRYVSPPQATFPHNAVSHHSRCDGSITVSALKKYKIQNTKIQKTRFIIEKQKGSNIYIKYKLLYYYNNIIIYSLTPTFPTPYIYNPISTFFVILYFVFCIFCVSKRQEL